jgi:hypothetical protein
MPVVVEVVGAERRVAGEVQGPPAADVVHRPVQASPEQRVPDDQTGDHERGQERPQGSCVSRARAVSAVAVSFTATAMSSIFFQSGRASARFPAASSAEASWNVAP